MHQWCELCQLGFADDDGDEEEGGDVDVDDGDEKEESIKSVMEVY